MKACFCYKVITSESAEHGKAAEYGWILPGHRECPLQDADGYHDEVLDQARAGDFNETDLSTVVRFAQELGICEDSGRWLSSIDPDHGDYSTDEQRFYSLHIEGVTLASYRRIARLIRGDQ